MSKKQTATRRRFFAGASAVLAAPAIAAAEAGEAGDRDTLAARLAAFEDANAIRELQRAYAAHLNAGAPAAAAALFAAPVRATFDETIRGLSDSAAESLSIAPDRRTAEARSACVVRIETPIDAPGCTLVDMARAQGEGTMRRTERRELAQTFVRIDGVWKIDGVELRAPGRSA